MPKYSNRRRRYLPPQRDEDGYQSRGNPGEDDSRYCRTSSPSPLNEENKISVDVITLTAENNNLKRMYSLHQQLMQEQTNSLAAKDNELGDLKSKRHMVAAQNQELKRANEKLEATIGELLKQLSIDDDDDYPPLQQLKLCDAEQQTLLEEPHPPQEEEPEPKQGLPHTTDHIQEDNDGRANDDQTKEQQYIELEEWLCFAKQRTLLEESNILNQEEEPEPKQGLPHTTEHIQVDNVEGVEEDQTKEQQHIELEEEWLWQILQDDQGDHLEMNGDGEVILGEMELPEIELGAEYELVTDSLGNTHVVEKHEEQPHKKLEKEEQQLQEEYWHTFAEEHEEQVTVDGIIVDQDESGLTLIRKSLLTNTQILHLRKNL